jgi:hypothetical protein
MHPNGISRLFAHELVGRKNGMRMNFNELDSTWMWDNLPEIHLGVRIHATYRFTLPDDPRSLNYFLRFSLRLKDTQ